MDLYKTNKFQSKYENILFVSKLLYELINKPISVDLLFKKFEVKTGGPITYEYEQTLLLSLCFMFSTSLIRVEDNKIGRCK